MPIHSHSPVISKLINKFAPKGIGAEIGIYKGLNARHILSRTEISHLYMIDPWIKNYAKSQLYMEDASDPDKHYKKVQTYFTKHQPGRTTVIRKKSDEAINDVPDELDFIFIDGNHNYEYVMRDLINWVPKVKSNGLVSGHDWWRRFPGVIRAVKRFFSRNSMLFYPPTHKIEGFIPAPSKSPVIMKSWPTGWVWWAIKR